MKIQLETGGSQNIIRAYGQGRVTVNQEVFTTSLVLMPEQIVPDWPPRVLADIRAEHFELVRRLKPEVLILGTGRRLQFPPDEHIRTLVQARIGFEVMDTGAACRTYNILLSEGRRVAAALLMIEP